MAEVSCYRNIQTSVVVCPNNWPCFSVVIHTHCKALMKSLRSDGRLSVPQSMMNLTVLQLYLVLSCVV